LESVKAVVQKVIREGKHGPFAVATSDQLKGSVTFSLEPTVWQESDQPEEGMYVFLGNIRQKRAGWRITKDIYDNKLEELKDQQYRLGIELEEHTKADHQYHIHVATVLNLCRRIRTIFDDPRSEVSEKRAILNFILQNPTVDGKKLMFTMRKPFDAVLELAECPNWLRALSQIRTACQAVRGPNPFELVHEW
jgi:hypothetical protein